MRTAVETAMETSIRLADSGKITSEQLQEQLQNAMRTAVETAMETSIQFISESGISTEYMKEKFSKIQTELEEKLTSQISLHLNGRVPTQHALISTTFVTRAIEGVPQYTVKGLLQTSISAATFPRFVPKNAAAVSYTPRTNIFHDPNKSEFELQLQRYIAKMRSLMAKNARLPGGRVLDAFFSTKLGGALMQFVDFFDTISDVLSVVCTFTDGFFYDPDRTGLSWEPWDPSTFRDARQKIIDAQLDVIKEYNDQIGPGDFDYPYSRAQYPIIVGPLAKIPIPDRYHGDVEYIQMKIGTEIDVVIEKILRDESSLYHQRLLELKFDNDEEYLKNCYTDPMYPDDKLIYYLSYIENNNCKEFDDLYRTAFTKVCEANDGMVYEDDYINIEPKEGVTCPANYARRRFQCGFKTQLECEINATEYIAENGQIGSYGEWADMRTLKDKNDNRLVPDESRIYTGGKQSACILIGQGIRSLCKQATLTDNNYVYDPDNKEYKCQFTEELCQSFGTCVATDSSGQTYCEIPKAMQGAQMFFGSQLPREWVRIHGCHYAPISGQNSDQENFNNVLGFFTSGGQQFFDDMLGNMANWNQGMKEMFIGQNGLETWMNLTTILLPMLLAEMGMSAGPLMVLIFIIVGSQMADAAVKANRTVAQSNPNEAAEYTTGGWKTSQLYSTVYVLKSVTRTSATTAYAHGITSGKKIRLLGLKWTDGSTITIIPSVDLTVTSVPDSTTLVFNSMPFTLNNFVNFLDDRGYVKEIVSRQTYTLRPDGSNRKIPQPVGYVDGWITKPLRPKNNNGQIVPVTAGVSSISAVVEKDFFIDVKPDNRAYPDGQSCTNVLTNLRNNTTTLINDMNSFNFDNIKNDFENRIRAANARFAPLISNAQNRVNSLNSDLNNIRSSCSGIGIINGDCLAALGQGTFDSLSAAVSTTIDLIEEAGKTLDDLTHQLGEALEAIFIWLGDQLKSYFTRAYELAIIDISNPDFSGRCVNTRITLNFQIAQALGNFVSGKILQQVTRTVLEEMGCPDHIINTILEIEYWGVAIGTLGVSTSKCIMTGKVNPDVLAFSDECYKATAVDSATGTITRPGGAMVNQHIDWDNWMDKDEYKRMCSELDPPMIRAWNASLANKVWCISSRPPESWADPTIGILDPLETQYAVNRAWTNFGDGPDSFSIDYPQYPDGVLFHQDQETQERDSAKHWWYQLVYSKDDFNRSILWDNTILQEHFTYQTIVQMRREYCTDDLLGNENRGIEPVDPSNIDDQCWGYLSIAIAGYAYKPMSILSKMTT